jgi:DNA-binding transcriptional LysR family regulator
MEFRELKSLAVLAETGSLSRTARSVHLTPAAVHKQLKQLEDELQVPLYERRDGHLRLTAAAELLLPYLRDILGQYESAVSALEEWKGVRRGLLRIGAGPSLAIYLLPEMLRRYHDRFPKVDVDLQTGSSAQLLDGLQQGTLDLSLVVAPESMEDLSVEVEVEMRAEVVFVTSMAAPPKRCAMKQLGGMPFLLFRKGARIENLIDRYLSDHGLSPEVTMRFDSAEALKATLVLNTGVSMLPRYTVEEEIRQGKLRAIRQKEAPLFMKIHLLRRRAGYVPPAVRAFVETAARTLGGKTQTARG